MTGSYTFHISGLHCASCVALTESELGEVPGVTRVKASLQRECVEVAGDFGDKPPERLAEDFTEVLKKHGFALSIEKQKSRIRWSDFRLAVPLAAGFITLFIALQKLGVVNWVTTGSHVSYGTAILIGVIASLSSCMAIVGGLVLSISANFAKGGDTLRPQLLFHVGRLASFFLLGGLIGAAGSVFRFGDRGMFVVQLIVSAAMFILGINLLEIFPWAKKLQPALPGFLGKRVRGLKEINHTATPFLVGVATFFLPCGFTQAMQLYSITTGTFASGAMIMFSFALGTLPVLALLSFSSFGIQNTARSGIFFKTSGLVVVFFALFNLANACVGAGIIPPLFNL
jgi:sulfite exporter TauE/SafE/copper chaperone CopZ